MFELDWKVAPNHSHCLQWWSPSRQTSMGSGEQFIMCMYKMRWSVGVSSMNVTEERK